MKKSFQQVLLLLSLLSLSASAVSARATAKENFAKLREKVLNANTKSKGNLFLQSLENLHREPCFDQDHNRTLNDMWIKQKLDHFDPKNSATWQMRYLMNNRHYKKGGPMFIFVGGEWAITQRLITDSHFADMAAEHKGMLYYTEHRYYGESKPTSDISKENLKYLHVKQALADLAHFIKYQRKKIPGMKNSKVILAGGSYSGTMVIWFKRLYPELFVGGWASSAPLFAKMEFEEYMEVCGRSVLELGGQQCYDRIKNGVAELESMIEQGRGAEVRAKMGLCDTFDENNELDRWSLFATTSNLFAEYIQYQRDNDMPGLCDYLLSFEDDVTAVTEYFLSFSNGTCWDASYNHTLTDLRNTTYSNGMSRPWFYQTCNEYGWYQTSVSKKQPFGTKFPIGLKTQLCKDTFGDEYTIQNIKAGIAQTNEDFGGLSVTVENIYETHGALDPWNAVGHTAKDGAVIIPKESHASDLRRIRANDSAPLSASRERISELVRLWLAE